MYCVISHYPVEVDWFIKSLVAFLATDDWYIFVVHSVCYLFLKINDKVCVVLLSMTQARFEIRLTAEAAYREIRCIRENEGETCVPTVSALPLCKCSCVLSRAFVFHAFELSVWPGGPVSVYLLCSTNDQINWREEEKNARTKRKAD